MIARFLSVDPLAPEYPWYTPYQFAGNKPIVAVDLDGLEELHYLNSMDKVLSGINTFVKTTDKMTKNYADIQKKELDHIKIYIDHRKLSGNVLKAGGITSNITGRIQYAVTIQNYLADPQVSESNLSPDQLAAYQEGTSLATKLGIKLDQVQSDDEFFHVSINKNLIYGLEIGSDPVGGGLNPITWQEDIFQAVETLFHEIIAHVTERVEGGKKGVDHNRYFDFEGFEEFYGEASIKEYMRTNASPSVPAPSSRAGKMRTDIQEALEQVEKNVKDGKND